MLKCLIPQRFKSSAHLAQCKNCQSQFRRHELAESILAVRAERIEQHRHTSSHDFMLKLANRLRIEREASLSTWETAMLSWRNWSQMFAMAGAMALLLIALATTLALKPATQEEEVFTATTVESASLNGFWMGD